jgi:acetylornithine deacetylase/succinyl-diaminopimelate desuccinylase-like protein
MSELEAVLERIDRDLDKSIDRLFDFLKIQSVSTDPAYKEQCLAAANHIALDLKSLGFETQIRPTQGHPIVVGRAPNGSGPRVLFYGHYDVQPVDPLDMWQTPPFSPRIEELPGGR